MSLQPAADARLAHVNGFETVKARRAASFCIASNGLDAGAPTAGAALSTQSATRQALHRVSQRLKIRRDHAISSAASRAR
jgi:hypothetical protein